MSFDQRETDIRGCQIGMRRIANKYITDGIKVAESAADSGFNVMAFHKFIPSANENNRGCLTGIYSVLRGLKHLLEQAGS